MTRERFEAWLGAMVDERNVKKAMRHWPLRNHSYGEEGKIGGGSMPRKKRLTGAQDIEARQHDIEASQWNESRMSAIVQRLDTELHEIVERLGSCLKHEIHPEHRQEFRERVRDLLDTFTDDLENVLQGTTEDDE